MSNTKSTLPDSPAKEAAELPVKKPDKRRESTRRKAGPSVVGPAASEGLPLSTLRDFGALTPDARRTLRDLAIALAIIGASLTAFVVWRGGRVSAGSPRVGSVQIEGAPPARR